MLLYYPCIADSQGRILKIVCNVQMSKNEAETFLKGNYWGKWLKCEAIPQLVTTNGLHH